MLREWFVTIPILYIIRMHMQPGCRLPYELYKVVCRTKAQTQQQSLCMLPHQPSGRQLGHSKNESPSDAFYCYVSCHESAALNMWAQEAFDLLPQSVKRNVNTQCELMIDQSARNHKWHNIYQVTLCSDSNCGRMEWCS